MNIYKKLLSICFVIFSLQASEQEQSNNTLKPSISTVKHTDPSGQRAPQPKRASCINLKKVIRTEKIGNVVRVFYEDGEYRDY
jgi:hypothetical protein